MATCLATPTAAMRSNYTIPMTATDTVSEELDLDTVLGLFDDEYARVILAATSTEPRTVQEIADRTEAAPSTLYRRVERLVSAGLLDERTRVRADGHHDSVYQSVVTDLHVSIEDGEFEFEVETESEDAADRLQRLWSDF